MRYVMWSAIAVAGCKKAGRKNVRASGNRVLTLRCAHGEYVVTNIPLVPAHAGMNKSIQEKREMFNLKRALIALWKNEEGLTTVEYAVAGALISLAVVAAFTGLGARVTAVITAITAALPAG